MINALALHIFICCTFFPREPRLCTFTLLTVFFPSVTAQWRDPSPGTGRGMLHPERWDAAPRGHAAGFGVHYGPGFGVWAGRGLGTFPPCAPTDTLGLSLPGIVPVLSTSCQHGTGDPVSPPAALPAQPEPPVPPTSAWPSAVPRFGDSWDGAAVLSAVTGHFLAAKGGGQQGISEWSLHPALGATSPASPPLLFPAFTPSLPSLLFSLQAPQLL